MPIRRAAPTLLLLTLAACSAGRGAAPPAAVTPAPPAAAPPTSSTDASAPATRSLPPSGADAAAHIAASPRHAEWAMVPVGEDDSVRVWYVYPENVRAAPVVLVVHEIFGLTPWIRAVADQVAAEGYLGVAPDLLTGHGVAGGPEGPDPEAARAAIRALPREQVQRRLDAVARWAMRLPGSRGSYGIMGFCWGGAVAFEHAALSGNRPNLQASIVFYGTSPDEDLLARVATPVLGLYGGDDARVNATIPPAEEALRARGRIFEHEIYPGAGHGFLRQQDGRDGANLAATRAAWPRAIGFLERIW